MNNSIAQARCEHLNRHQGKPCPDCGANPDYIAPLTATQCKSLGDSITEPQPYVTEPKVVVEDILVARTIDGKQGVGRVFGPSDSWELPPESVPDVTFGVDEATSFTHQQVGGTHYDKPIQPIEYIDANQLGFCEGNIIKYITRYKDKNGLEDLHKVKWYIEHLIEHYDD